MIGRQVHVLQRDLKLIKTTVDVTDREVTASVIAREALGYFRFRQVLRWHTRVHMAIY